MSTATSTAWTLDHVALTSIKAHPDNPRTDVGDVDDLVASIAETGILEPLVVAPPHDGMNARSMGKATHLLIAGHRRLAAAKKAKLTTVPVIVRSDLATRASQVEAMLVENLQRVDLTPVEEADAYQLVIDIEGLTQKDLAAKVGQPVSRIRDRLKLTKIGPAAREKLQAHQVSITEAIAIAEFDDDPKRQKEILKAVGGTNLEYTINRARNERNADERRAATLAAIEAAGMVLTKEQPKGARSLYDLGITNYLGSDDVEAAAAAHGECPGRAVWHRYSGLEYGCTEPKFHPRPKATKSKAELDREAKEKAFREDIEPKLAAAAEARDAFLRRLIMVRAATTAAPEILQPRLRSMILSALELSSRHYWSGQKFDAAQTFLTIMCGTAPTKEKGEKEDALAARLRDDVDAILTGLAVDGLVIALDLARNTGDERYLRTPNQYVDYARAADWLRALGAYGYTWSDFEREQFVWQEDEGDDGTRSWTVDGRGDFVPFDESEAGA